MPRAAYICLEGHLGGVLAENGCEECYGTTREVRVYTEEEVRPLLEAARVLQENVGKIEPDFVRTDAAWRMIARVLEELE